MISLANEPWYKIPYPKTDLNLEYTLGGGQSFRWKKASHGEWRGVFCSRFWILKQTDNFLLFKVAKRVTPCMYASPLVREVLRSGYIKKFLALVDKNPVTLTKEEMALNIADEINDADGMLLSKYLRLDVNLQACYSRWGERDPLFQKAARKCNGVRLLYQEPVETIFAFICSSNNNIKRISSMVNQLCSKFGDLVGDIDGELYYDFPELDQLIAPKVLEILTKARFGYRAAFIYKSACMMQQMGGHKWIDHLKRLSYEAARKELLKLPGIGSKVADCICLMSLGHLNAVPVDTHIHQVAKQYYMKKLRNSKTLSNAMYLSIMKFFQELHGPDAGWAQTVLFCADLKNIGDLDLLLEQDGSEICTRAKRKCVREVQKRKSYKSR